MGGKADTHRLAAVAAHQKGLVTRADVLAAGGTRRFIDRKLEDGWLHRVHTGVYAVGHPSLTLHARWLAGVLALGERAALSHRPAGGLWGIADADGLPAEVTVATTAGLGNRDDIVVHRQRLSRHERTLRHGIPTTTLARTLIDLAAVLDPRALADAFEEAQVHHRLQPAALAAEVVARPGHRGIARLRALLADAVDPGQVESRLELRFLKLCRAHDLPRPLTQVRIGRWRADFLFAGQRLVIETDSARFHHTAAKHRRDAAKTTDLQAAGYAVLRLRWADVVHAPQPTAARIRAALT